MAKKKAKKVSKKIAFKSGGVRYSTKSDRGQEVIKQNAISRLTKKMGL